jgi:hypothetical protein
MIICPRRVKKLEEKHSRKIEAYLLQKLCNTPAAQHKQFENYSAYKHKNGSVKK